MHAVETAGRDPPGDRTPADSGFDQLTPADHSVLACRQLSDANCVPKRPVGGRNGTQFGHAPILAT